LAKRVRIKDVPVEGVEEAEPLPSAFLASGCTLLDCNIGGGWPVGRIVNIIGDKSTGKTLLAEEAIANFQRQYPQGRAWYRESEASFDASYAQALGLKTDMIDFGPDGADTMWSTIEDVFEDLNRCLTKQEQWVERRAKTLREKNRKLAAVDALAKAQEQLQPGLYIIDSLDALSSVTELARDIREGSYNLSKQKLLGELFRTMARRVRRARICLIFISQTRARISTMPHGKQYTRSGGKALDFYSSVILLLSEVGKITRTVNGIKRVIGVKIKVKVEKNKVTSPHGECEFPIRFKYGIDDEMASLDYLKAVKKLEAAGFNGVPADIEDIDAKKLQRDTIRIWRGVEAEFSPPRGKYANA
jgi:recombination protein RecA